MLLVLIDIFRWKMVTEAKVESLMKVNRVLTCMLTTVIAVINYLDPVIQDGSKAASNMMSFNYHSTHCLELSLVLAGTRFLLGASYKNFNPIVLNFTFLGSIVLFVIGSVLWALYMLFYFWKRVVYNK